MPYSIFFCITNFIMIMMLVVRKLMFFFIKNLILLLTIYLEMEEYNEIVKIHYQFYRSNPLTNLILRSCKPFQYIESAIR